MGSMGGSNRARVAAPPGQAVELSKVVSGPVGGGRCLTLNGSNERSIPPRHRDQGCLGTPPPGPRPAVFVPHPARRDSLDCPLTTPPPRLSRGGRSPDRGRQAQSRIRQVDHEKSALGRKQLSPNRQLVTLGPPVAWPDKLKADKALATPYSALRGEGSPLALPRSASPGPVR